MGGLAVKVPGPARSPCSNVVLVVSVTGWCAGTPSPYLLWSETSIEEAVD